MTRRTLWPSIVFISGNETLLVLMILRKGEMAGLQDTLVGIGMLEQETIKPRLVARAPWRCCGQRDGRKNAVGHAASGARCLPNLM